MNVNDLDHVLILMLDTSRFSNLLASLFLLVGNIGMQVLKTGNAFEYVCSIFPAVGVPLMLTYVYGVVPMSLCRNGWCRPQTEAPEMRKIQLEDLATCKSRC